MILGALKSRYSVPFALVCASILVLAPLMAHARQQDRLVGSWTLKSAAAGDPARERVFHTFAFKEDGTVEVHVVMADGIGSGMGEALGDTGHYRLRGNRLMIVSSKEPGDGWPTGGNRGRIKYSCKVSFPESGENIRLSQCPISGLLIRSSH